MILEGQMDKKIFFSTNQFAFVIFCQARYFRRFPNPSKADD